MTITQHKYYESEYQGMIVSYILDKKDLSKPSNEPIQRITNNLECVGRLFVIHALVKIIFRPLLF